MGTNTLQSAKVGLQILSTIVKSVPIPEPFKSAVVGIPDAVLQIITIVETAKGNMEDAKVLALYIATMTDRTIRPLDLCSITPVTQRRIHEFQEALQQITEEITTLASQRSPRKWIFHYDRDAAKLYALKQRVVDAIAGIQLETVVATSQEVDIMSQKQDLAHEDHKAIIRKQDLIYQEQLVLVQKQDIIYQEQQDLIRKQQEAEIDRLIALLGSGDSGSSKKPPCLDGTRASLLKWISKWIETIPVDDKRGLCLVGAAGRGKSSVGASVAEDERKLKRLGADFYFTVDQQDRNQGVIPVLARQLASWGDRRLRVEIASVVDDDRDIAQRTLEVQFKKLIQEPLETLKDDPNCPPLVILLDGLDEGGNEYISRLLHLIGQSFARLPAAVRFIITSRPEPHLIHHYASEPLDTRLYIRSLDLEDVGEVERDIEAFFKRELPRMVLGLVKRPSNWPGEQRLRILVRMAGGLWIWAVTVARMLTDQRIRDPERQLDALLSTVPDIHGEYGHNVDLYAVYSMILNRACPLDAHSQLLALFRNVLGALCVVKTPINIHTLVSLLCLDRSSGENIADDIPTRVLGYLQAVLIVPGIDEEVPSHDTKPIRFIHKSFEDYLLDESRYNVRFLVNIAEQHRWMAIRCMRRMDDLQNTNICHLYPNVLTTRTAILWRSKGKDFVFDLARQHISSALLYACENWTTHVSGALPGCDDVYASVDTLARTGLLNWLEVLSLQGRIEKVEELVELVEVWLKARYIQVAAKSPKTHPTASVNEPPIKIQPGMHIRTDAVHAMSGPIALRILMRFLASFLPVQQPTAPPQASTLSTESDVSALNLLQDLKHFVREFKIPIIAGPVHIYHSALPFIPLHTSLSRTYGHLAGGGPRPRRGWLQQWSDHNCCVAWSPDSQRIVSGSWNGTLRLWDPSKGASIGEAWNFHAKKVNCVAWSPDGETLVSGSDDCTLQLWDSTTGGRVGEAWKGHTDGVLSVAWSPDGKRVVSGSADRTLRMWDPSTGAPIGGPWKSRTLAVRCVTWSPDGKKIGSSSDDGIIRLWCSDTGAVIRNLCGEYQSFYSLAWSPDGKWIISAHVDNTLCMWDASTGYLIRDPWRGHSDIVSCVAWSPDGKKIVSGSHDRTLRLWDPPTRAPIGDAWQGHTSHVRCLSWSPDGKMVVSGSEDGVVIMWNSTTGELFRLIHRGPDSHTRHVYSLGFTSPNDIITASSDGTVRLWDSSSGALIGNPMRQTPRVTNLDFVLDGKYVVSEDEEHRTIWEVMGEPGYQQSGPIPDDRVRVFKVDGDGWIQDPQGKRMFWLPVALRPIDDRGRVLVKGDLLAIENPSVPIIDISAYASRI